MLNLEIIDNKICQALESLENDNTSLKKQTLNFLEIVKLSLEKRLKNYSKIDYMKIEYYFSIESNSPHFDFMIFYYKLGAKSFFKLFSIELPSFSDPYIYFYGGKTISKIDDLNDLLEKICIFLNQTETHSQLQFLK